MLPHPATREHGNSARNYLSHPGAVWNIDLNNFPRANAILCHSMCGDERRLPLDARPTLGAVSLVVPIVKAGGHQEQCFVRGKRINADMMWCLQFALCTTHAIYARLAKRAEGGATLVGRKYTETRLALNRTAYWANRGGKSTHSPSQRRVTPKQPYRCSQLNT